MARLSPDAIRGIGQLEAVSIAKILQSGDSSAALFAAQMAKSLDNQDIALMLSNQAITTNALGNRYLQLSVDLSDVAPARDMASDYMRISIKAFELSRKALVALNEIRNPRQTATFIKQQNNLLNQNDKTLDTARTRSAIPINQEMAALAEGRCEISRREGD